MLGHNLLRKLLLARYVPRQDGQVIPIPIAAQYVKSTGNGYDLNAATEAENLECIAQSSGRGVEVF